jgi:predicted membrane protein
MIKNIIIYTLIFLLLTVILFYYSLHSNLHNYQKDRLDLIIQKEKEIYLRQQSLDEINYVSEQLDRCKLALYQINNLANNTSNDITNKISTESTPTVSTEKINYTIPTKTAIVN